MCTKNNEAAELMKKAYETLDVDLLKKAVALGADVNQRGAIEDETLFEGMVYDFGCDVSCGVKDDRYLGDNIIRFVDVLLENGLDLNHHYKDGKETISTFHDVSRWGHNKLLLEYLLQHGMDPNIIDDDDFRSAWDELDQDIFAEECCGYPECAAWFYNAGRLAIAYGAKPIDMLRPQEDGRPQDMVDAARRLDCDALKGLSAEDIVRYYLCMECTYYSKFVSGHDFYYDRVGFDQRLMRAMDVIIDKIGVDAIDSHALLNCVEGQFPITLEHLLERGVDPNTNCFTPSYSWVSSSALYELDHRGGYIEDQEVRNRMWNALTRYGAVIK